MKFEVHPGVSVGDLDSCGQAFASAQDLAVVHACKMPCHQMAVGYGGTLPSDHPDYLHKEKGGQLYLNLIDPPVPLFKLESFAIFRRYAAEQHAQGRPLLIHCNLGLSRAPSLALLFLAKDLRVLPAESYEAAAKAFRNKYPAYSPGKGISTFMGQHWEAL